MLESPLVQRDTDLSGVPEERPIPDLPIQRPDFRLLFGSDPGPSSSSTIDAAEKGSIISAKGKEKATEGESVVRRTQVGGADVDVTDKLTMTWVSSSIAICR
jgi:N-acyl-phosphatidylethanolamine-hydrolysing phospholipase D